MTPEELMIQMFNIDSLARDFLQKQRAYNVLKDFGRADSQIIAKNELIVPAIDYSVAIRQFHNSVQQMIAEWLEANGKHEVAQQIRDLLLTIKTGDN